jgi:hypothetical protein
MKRNKGWTKGKILAITVLAISICAVAMGIWYVTQLSTSASLLERFPNAQAWRDLYNTLTPDQKEIVKDKISEMRSTGATQEEISAALNELLSSWGYNVP